jgi:hypothetical protein
MPLAGHDRAWVEDARRPVDDWHDDHRGSLLWARADFEVTRRIMFHKLMSLILVGGLILNSSVCAASAAEEQAGTASNLQAKARNAMEGHKQVVVITRSEKDGTKKFPGTISDVSDKGLTLVEKQTGRTMAMSDQEIRDIKGKSAHWPIYVAIAIGAAAVILGVMFHELSKD